MFEKVAKAMKKRADQMIGNDHVCRFQALGSSALEKATEIVSTSNANPVNPNHVTEEKSRPAETATVGLSSETPADRFEDRTIVEGEVVIASAILNSTAPTTCKTEGDDCQRSDIEAGSGATQGLTVTVASGSQPNSYSNSSNLCVQSKRDENVHLVFGVPLWDVVSKTYTGSGTRILEPEASVYMYDTLSLEEKVEYVKASSAFTNTIICERSGIAVPLTVFKHGTDGSGSNEMYFDNIGHLGKYMEDQTGKKNLGCVHKLLVSAVAEQCFNDSTFSVHLSGRASCIFHHPDYEKMISTLHAHYRLEESRCGDTFDNTLHLQREEAVMTQLQEKKKRERKQEEEERRIQQAINEGIISGVEQLVQKLQLNAPQQHVHMHPVQQQVNPVQQQMHINPIVQQQQMSAADQLQFNAAVNQQRLLQSQLALQHELTQHWK